MILEGPIRDSKAIVSHSPLLGAISLDRFAVLFGGATALLPIYARDILHTTSVGLGVLRTAPGIGAAVCALVLSLSPLERHVGRWLFAGVGVFGVATVVFGLSTNIVVSVIALTLLGAGDMVSVYLRHLLVQLETPDEIRARSCSEASRPCWSPQLGAGGSRS